MGGGVMGDEVLSQPVTLNRADGSTVTLKRCSPADRLQFRQAFRFYRKMLLNESLSLRGINGKEAVEHLTKFDARRLYESDVDQWVLEPEGQNEALLLSLRKDNPGATAEDVFALGLTDDEKFVAAAGVLNIPLKAATEGEGSKDSPPQSPPPPSGGTDSGEGTPTPSATTPGTPTP